MPKRPFKIPRPFLSEQGLVGIDVWDREITEEEARRGDIDIFKVNIAPDQSNIVFNRSRIPLADINKYSSDLSLPTNKSWVGGSRVKIGIGPGPLFKDTMLDQRLLVILRESSLSERDVKNLMGDLTEAIDITSLNGVITFTTHVISVDMSNKASEKLGVSKDDFIFQGGIMEVEQELITTGGG